MGRGGSGWMEQIVKSTIGLYARSSGGPGDASGGSGRARGRLLRPARGRDGQMSRHANLRGGEGF